MSGFFSSLYARLTLVFAALLILVGYAFLLLANWSNHRYYQEVTQNLNKSLAMYIAQREALIQGGKVNEPAMKELGALAMVVNPIVEVYLLDNQGKIISSAVPADTVVRHTLNLAPITAALKAQKPFPITGDDPRSLDGERIFSVFPVTDGQAQAGYLYVILGGQVYQGLSQALRSSYILQTSLGGLAGILLFALISATLIFFVFTRPLRRLALALNQFQQQELNQNQQGELKGDEITYLTGAFESMQARIREQFAELQESDRLRRELVSNVSHDLRTPMSSMQGYLEMLLRPDLSEQERKNYLDIALKHCYRLAQLVKELFELSKLDAGRITPNLENFSLAELLQDVVQKFYLSAQQKNIAIKLPADTQLCLVYADISLIERVLENLIDNALRYTPAGGQIDIRLSQQQETVTVRVQDNGIGLGEDDLPHIFERFYRGQKPQEYQQDSTGLGLAIVKRILELHHSVITVESNLNAGTCFQFPLKSLHQLNAA